MSREVTTAEDTTYTTHMKEVDKLLTKLQACEDVDEALQLFEEANRRIKACEAKIENAKGRFTEMTCSET